MHVRDMARLAPGVQVECKRHLSRCGDVEDRWVPASVLDVDHLGSELLVRVAYLDAGNEGVFGRYGVAPREPHPVLDRLRIVEEVA